MSSIRELKQRQRRRQRERQKQKLGLDKQNNYFARASRFSVHFFAVDATFVEKVDTRPRLSFSFSELRYSVLKFNSRKNCQHLANRTIWNKREKL